MKNIFSGLKKKLTRREKKGKPVPVPHKAPVRQEPEPAEPKIKATFMRPPLRQERKHRAVWDEEARVHRGENYWVQADGVQRNAIEEFIERSMVVPVEIFYETHPERYSKAPESASGYDYPMDTVSSSYVAPSPSYEAPTYSYDSGSSSSSPSNSYSSSDGGSSGGGYGGGE